MLIDIWFVLLLSSVPCDNGENFSRRNIVENNLVKFPELSLSCTGTAVIGFLGDRQACLNTSHNNNVGNTFLEKSNIRKQRLNIFEH